MDTEIESRADQFAGNCLLNAKDYSDFLEKGAFDIGTICDFSKKQNVKPYIVIGRLQREGKLKYTQFSEYKARYKWADP